MKCKMTEKRNMTFMLVIGLAMAVTGAAAAFCLPDEAHTLTRCAGALTGAGTAFAAMGGGVLLWRAIVGEKRAAESEMRMLDERGQMIAAQAQSVLALAAVFSLVVIVLAALVRGDLFNMALASGLCVLCAVTKAVAAFVLSKRM